MSDVVDRQDMQSPPEGESAGPAGRGWLDPEGWYPDPSGRTDLRWWTGESWSTWAMAGQTLVVDPMVDRRILTRDDIGHLAFIEFVFLPELAQRGGLPPSTARRAREALGGLAAEATSSAALTDERAVRPAAAHAPLAGAASTPAPGPSVGSLGLTPAAAVPDVLPTTGSLPWPTTVAVPRPPGPLSLWWGRTRESVGSDLAVHGIAYLGVLLFFVGVFGLVAFAFGDVERSLRPVAEVIIASAPFAAASLLLRRGAVIVGRALEVVGGLLLPVMLITSFLDGMSFPPDLDGTALVIALTASCAVITMGYALWVRRHPASGLRFVVAPMVWFTAAMASLGLGRPIPAGEAVAVPGAAQVAVALVVLLLTVVWAQRRPGHPLSEPTRTSAVTGSFVLGLLAVLTWGGAGAPSVAAVLVSGLAGLATLELLGRGPAAPEAGPAAPNPTARETLDPQAAASAPAGPVRLAPGVLGVVEPLWWALATLAIGGPWGAVLAVIGLLGILELAALSRRPGWALAIPAVLAVAAVPAMGRLPWVTVAVLAGATAWAIWRRRIPFVVNHAPGALDLAAAILPALTLLALAAASSLPLALAAGAVLVLLATVPATRPVLHRGLDDGFWRLWWWVASGCVAVGAASLWVAFLSSAWQPAVTVPDQWMVVASVAVLAVAAVLGPIPRLLRPWAIGALGMWAWILACTTASVPDSVRGWVPAALALGGVIAAHVRQRPSTGLAASVGLAAHAVALASIAWGGVAWGLLATVGLATAGFAVTSGYDIRDRSPVSDGLGQLFDPLRELPIVLTCVGLPLTVLIALDVTGAAARSGSWLVAVLAVAALAYAGATRAIEMARTGVTLAWTAFALALAAVLAGLDVAASSGSYWPLVAGLSAVIGVAPITAPARRSPVMVWVAWAALAPWAVSVLAEASAGFAAMDDALRASTVLIGVGGLMLVAAAVLDLRFRPWAPRWHPDHRALLPVAVLGAAEVVTGGILAATSSGAALGWRWMAVAAIALATAVLARVGLLGGVAVVVAWAAAAILVGPDATVSPWAVVGAAAVLIGISELARRLVPDLDWWSRWDVPLLGAAVPFAVSAIGMSVGGPVEAAVTAGVGVETLVVAGLWRHVRAVPVLLGPLGTGLVLVGAAMAGGLWLALALAVVSAALTVLAALSTGALRAVLQPAGALTGAAAWLAVVVAVEWAEQVAVDLTAVGGGLLTLVAAAVAWTRRIDRSWIVSWAGTAAGLVGLAAAIAHMGAPEVSPSGAVALALVMVAVAHVLAAGPLRLDWLRDLGVVWTIAAVVSAMTVWNADPRAQVLLLSVLSVAFALTLMLVGGRAPQWRRTIVELGVVTTSAGIAVSAASGESALLAPALAVAAVQAGACGAVLGVLWVQALSPLLACASWLVFASGALPADPQWWSMPIGLALLVVVGLWRRDRAAHGLPMTSPPVVAVEFAGLGFLVGGWVVQAVTSSVAFALPLLALGILIAGWGVVTRVRRRVGAGVVVVIAAVVLVVVVPLVHLLPSWGGAGLWVLIAAVGLAAVLIATLLEQGRAAVRTSLARFRDSTADWE